MTPRTASLALFAFAALLAAPAAAETLTGEAAFGDWSTDRPGVRRLITPADMPQPYATEPSAARAEIVPRGKAVPVVPEGFSVALVADRLERPRTMRVAPNGDIFLAESGAGRILVLRRSDDGSYQRHVFADGFDYPYGIAFYPSADRPEWLYIAETARVVRFPYAVGDTRAAAPAEVVVSGIPSRGHATRDLVFTPDGTMLLAVGSRSNVASDMPKLSDAQVADFEDVWGPGAAWGGEEGRAAVRAFDSEGKERHAYATGLRNCSGLSVQPATGAVWCAVNERDGLGDNLPPDFLTRVPDGSFFGWPWYYIGANQDPRHAGARADLRAEVTTPDVLLQPHSAPLAITFYEGDAFPAEYRGDGFAALHGSWNRGAITGYKVVRVIIDDTGVPTGEYEDFAVGFVKDAASAWGRPSGITVDRDGALLVSEDGNGTIWRISPSAR